MGIAVVAAFAVAYLHASAELTARETVFEQISDGDTVSVQGEISKKQIKEDQCLYELENCYILISGEAVSCNHILLYLDEDTYPIREILIATGQVNMFYQAVNEGNFDQRSYYRSRKIDFKLDDAEVTAAVTGSSGGYEEQLYQLRKRLQETLISITDEETAGVLSGMLLGEKSLLDAEVKSLYQKAGISHTLAISGLHLSVFAAGLYQLLRKRRFGFVSAGICAIFFAMSYTIMTGASVSTMRAAVMFGCTVCAAMVRRTYDLLNGLGFVVLLLLWDNPFLIGYSGFWFSLAAMLGIGFAVRILADDGRSQSENGGVSGAANGSERRFCALLRELQLKKKWKEALAGGVGIQAATIPMVAYFYHEVPVYAILLNLLVVPLLTAVLVSGAAGMLVGSIWLPLGKVLVYPAAWILKLYQVLCEMTLSWPMAQQITGTPTLAEMAGYYALLALLLYGRYRYMRQGISFMQKDSNRTLQENALSQQEMACKPWDNKGVSQRHRFPWTYAGILVLALVFCRCRVPAEEVDFLDVGQGDGIFISAGDGFCCFIDGGSSNVSSLGTYRILPFLKAKGAQDIDYWFVSHTDSDHISGITEVLESGYSVKYLVFSYAAPQDSALMELAETAEEAGTQVIYMDEGDMISFGSMQMICLYPLAGLSEEEINAEDVDKNARSLVLRMELCGTSFLFTGDISSDEEAEITDAYADLAVDVYKVAHHGSNYSSCEDFLEALHPALAVISCSSTNTYGHPGTETVARLENMEGITIYYTMQSGQVSMTWKDQIVVSEYLK